MNATKSQLSQSTQSDASSPSPYRRDNWNGDPEIDDSTPHDELDQYDGKRYKAEVAAHEVHSKVADKLDPITLFHPPNRGEIFGVSTPQARTLLRFLDSGEHIDEFHWPDEMPEHDPLAVHEINEAIELTDPELYVPLEEHRNEDEVILAGMKSKRWRHNEEQGHITGPHLADVPEYVFEAEVDIVLQMAQEKGMILADRAAELKRDAMRMKQSQGFRDLEALENIIYDIYAATE